MSVAVLARSVRDRGISVLIAAATVGLLLLLGMAVYADIDVSIYTELPAAVRGVMGIPAGADAASLSYSAMLGTIASLTLAGLAVSIGASAIAGEERDGTLPLLLANPVSRRAVLGAKLASLVVLMGAAGLALWGAGELAPVILGVEIGSTHVAAMALHLVVNALFHGCLALAIGGWTGRRSLASAVPTAVIVVSFLLAGLLPLLEATADLVNVVPWHYFDGSRPLVNGVAWSDVAVLAGGAAVLAGVAAVGVARRDLRSREVGATLLDRLRANPRTRQLADRLGGSARVSGIAAKAASDHQGLLAVVAALMVAMGVLLGPMYAAIEGDIADMAASLPDDLLAFAGGGDLSTPEGFYRTEILGLMAPIAAILVSIVVAARSVAGEEHDATMGLLLANPVSRARVLAEKAAVMVAFAPIVGVATFAGIAGGSLLGGLGLDLGNVAAAAALQVLLGLVFGGLALALGAATGRVAVAVYATAGAAVAAHVVNAFVSLNDQLAPWARISPFHYYASSEPLINGMPWGQAAVLALTAAALIALAFPLFQRRDLRQR